MKHAVLATTLLALLSLGSLAACESNTPTPKVEGTKIDDAANRKKPVDKPKTDDDKSRLSVDADVKQVCGIKDVKQIPTLGEQPKFDFESYELTADEKQVLDQVAECLLRGALKGKSVTLVGRADSRGEHEFNMSLGAYRASAVKNYLGQKGVEHTRMKETSRGAIDATGTEESGFREDRRVDITLGQ
jgi:peptidoglycan-associated lipoprotein